MASSMTMELVSENIAASIPSAREKDDPTLANTAVLRLRPRFCRSNLISESTKAVVRRYTEVPRSRIEVRHAPNVLEYLRCHAKKVQERKDLTTKMQAERF
jgi:hypothetical protein